MKLVLTSLLMLVPAAMLYAEIPLPGYKEALAREDKNLDAISSLVRQHLPEAVMPGGEKLGPESEDDLKTPVVPREAERKAAKAGVTSGYAEYCGMNWKANYLGFMNHYRHEVGFTPKQMAFLGILHGVMMEAGNNAAAQENVDCTSSAKQAIEAEYFKK